MFMCGVFGFAVKRERPADEVLAGLRDLEYRGYDSWGIAAASGDRLQVKKMVGPIAVETLGFAPTDLAIGHTRWATTGAVTALNAHPHLNEDQTVAAVHNGIIENYEPLKAGLIERGHRFQSETDTEVIAHLYEEAKENDSDPRSAFRAVWSQLSGLNAIVLLDLDARRLLFGRQGSPLAVGELSDGYAIASDGAALAGLCEKVVYLEDGWLGAISASKLELFDEEGRPLVPQWKRLSESDRSADDPHYPNRMSQEIHEQPEVLERLAASLPVPYRQAAELIKGAKNVFFLGCGTAHHAGQVGSSLFAAAGILAPAVLANEAAEFDQLVGNSTVLIVLSQSGETIDVIEPASRWQKRGAKIISLVNSPFSTLDRMANVTLHLQAGREKAVASTKAFSAMLAALTLLSAELSGRFSEGKRQVADAAAAARDYLSDDERQSVIGRLAKELAGKRDLFLLGRGTLRTIALEAALKVKEISYLHAEGMAAGELKHGTLALVEPGVPVVLFGDADQQSDTETTARELRARGAWVIGAGPSQLAVFDYYLPAAGQGLAGLIENALTAQWLAYHLSILKGVNPDRPRNLAKSVTVK
jgi:glucosamine--fructose-6-phosphate aminotransferase (isomerizing)